MKKRIGVPDSEEAKARAPLLAHFIDNPESVFYSWQLEVLFEKEYFSDSGAFAGERSRTLAATG